MCFQAVEYHGFGVKENMLVLSGKQRHIKLLHVSALDGGDSEPVKIAESKGCSTFCVGSVQQQGSSTASAVTAVGGGNGGVINCLCVAIKRTVQVYELVKSRQRYRKVKRPRYVVGVRGEGGWAMAASSTACVWPSNALCRSMNWSSPGNVTERWKDHVM